jgi:ADYC domain
LQNHLTACTRMLRADDCGDGKSWTVTGALINLYDGIGVQIDPQSWPSACPPDPPSRPRAYDLAVP